MKYNIRACLGMFRMKFIAGTQYRAAAWAGIATQFFWGSMNLLVFYAFYESSGMNSGQEAPMAFSSLADYVWLRQAFLSLIMLWAMDNDILSFIADGNVVYELARPLSLYSFWFARILGFRLSRVVLRCFPILIVAFFLPGDWGFHLPPDFASFVLFIPAMTLSALLSVALSMLVCLLTLISLNPIGARVAMSAAADFFMGALIPVPFMPPLLQRITYILPFRYLADFPFRVYSGDISAGAAFMGLGVQLIWLAILVISCSSGFKASLRRLEIQGG